VTSDPLQLSSVTTPVMLWDAMRGIASTARPEVMAKLRRPGPPRSSAICSRLVGGHLDNVPGVPASWHEDSPGAELLTQFGADFDALYTRLRREEEGEASASRSRPTRARRAFAAARHASTSAPTWKPDFDTSATAVP
jgi:hypothetical protein